MDVKVVTLWLFVLLQIASESSAFNVAIKENTTTFVFPSYVVTENFTGSSSKLPINRTPSYFGHSIQLYKKPSGNSEIMIGSPKSIVPSTREVSTVHRQGVYNKSTREPQGSLYTCALSSRSFIGDAQTCQSTYPSDVEPGDNLGMLMAVRSDGPTLACSVTRELDCERVRYTLGTCFESSSYAKSWNTSQKTDTTKCPTVNVEVLFVLDGSGSVGKSNFEIVRSWVKQIARKIDIDNGYVTVGVVQYSHYSAKYDINHQPNIVTEIQIGEHQTYTTFAAAVDKITLQGWTTYTGRALQKVMTDFRGTKHYNQPSTKQVLILLTDGQASDPNLVPKNAEKLRNIGVITYAVGVGSEHEVNRTELRLIASGDPEDDTRVYMTGSFAGLDVIAQELEGEISGLVLEGEREDLNGTGYEMQFGQMGLSIAFSKPGLRRNETNATTEYGVYCFEWCVCDAECDLCLNRVMSMRR